VTGTFPLAFGFAGCIAILLATPPIAEIAFTGLAAGMRAAQGLPRPLTHLLIDIIGYIWHKSCRARHERQAAIR
jgi:hypothetical protein